MDDKPIETTAPQQVRFANQGADNPILRFVDNDGYSPLLSIFVKDGRMSMSYNPKNMDEATLKFLNWVMEMNGKQMAKHKGPLDKNYIAATRPTLKSLKTMIERAEAMGLDEDAPLRAQVVIDLMAGASGKGTAINTLYLPLKDD